MIIIAGIFLIFNKDTKNKIKEIKSSFILAGNFFKNNSKEKKESIQIEDLNKLEKKKEAANIHERIINEIREDNLDLPDEIYNKVDFVSQAPFGIWDELHKEACEEASLIMVYYFLFNKKLTREKMDNEILALANYQKEKYGDYKDSNMEELKEIAENYYDLKKNKILKNFNINDLKINLAKGHLIIVPVAGRELNNPNFTPPGPIYHNLVLIGYNEKKEMFITNDPGTKRGKDYLYDFNVLYNAIHDFSQQESKIISDKKAIVFE